LLGFSPSTTLATVAAIPLLPLPLLLVVVVGVAAVGGGEHGCKAIGQVNTCKSHILMFILPNLHFGRFPRAQSKLAGGRLYQPISVPQHTLEWQGKNKWSIQTGNPLKNNPYPHHLFIIVFFFNYFFYIF
jgi:hypothetical protein